MRLDGQPGYIREQRPMPPFGCATTVHCNVSRPKANDVKKKRGLTLFSCVMVVCLRERDGLRAAGVGLFAQSPLLPAAWAYR